MRDDGAVNRLLTVAAAALAVAAAVFAVALQPSGAARINEASVAVVVAAYALVGAAILWSLPRHGVGTTALLSAVAWGVGEALIAGTNPYAGGLPAIGSTLGWLARSIPWLVIVLWLPPRFPDGLLPRVRAARAANACAVVSMVVFSAVTIMSPTIQGTDARNPLGLAPRWSLVTDLLGLVAMLLAIGAIVAGVVTLVVRYRDGGELGRQQTAVFALAFVPPVVTFVASAVSDGAPPWVFAMATLPLPVALGTAVLQRRLYDLPLALNRSLAYGGLLVTIASLYALVVGGVGVLARDPEAVWLPWLAAGVVAVSFAPLRSALERLANRATYGQWSRPGEVLSVSTRRLRDASDVGALLSSLVADIAEELGLGYVALADIGGRVIASYGSLIGDIDQMPVTAFGQTHGTLSWASRPLRPRDRDLVGDLAAHIGSAMHAAGLIDELQCSQARLVVAAEDERRRLRTEIHDGLGSTLAALTVKIDALRNQSDALGQTYLSERLRDVRSVAEAAVIDARRVVDGLRPAALDELGLAGSIAELADRLSTDSSVAILVTVGGLPRLSAATEVAAYRIVQEALTNVVRHASATQASVALSYGPTGMIVEVRDNGAGIPQTRRAGVGLRSMHERAREIGGSMHVDTPVDGGTAIVATLPMRVGGET